MKKPPQTLAFYLKKKSYIWGVNVKIQLAMERKLCGMLIRAVAFWAAFSVRAGEPELSGYSGFCDGDIVKDAVDMAVKVNQKLSIGNSNKEFTLIGHSMGGGQAAAASLKTGLPAITFNSAALTGKTKKSLQIQNRKGDVTNYVTLGKKVFSLFSITFYIGGDAVNNVQRKVGLKLEGPTIYIKTNSFSPSHGINTVIQNLKAKR